MRRWVALLSLVLFAFSPGGALAALNAAVVWAVNRSGDDTNSGGFKTGATGTDWSDTETTPQYSVTDGVTAGTTTITSATANFGTDVIGNLIYVQGGTGSVAADRYEITARASSSSITVDRSTGLTAGTGVTLKIGGALLSPGLAVSSATVAGHKVWIKYSATPYDISTFTVGAGGPLDFAAAGVFVGGFDSTRGDNTGNRPEIRATMAAPGALDYLVTGNGNNRQVLWNIQMDGAGVNNVGGANMANLRYAIVNCVAENFNGTSGVGYTCGGSYLDSCYANTCVTGFSGGGYNRNSTAKACTTGFNVTQGNILLNCLAFDSTGDGILLASTGCGIFNCTTVDNAGDGIDAAGNGVTIVDCLSAYNGGYAYNSSAVTTNLGLIRACEVSGSNTSGRIPSGIPQFDVLDLSASVTGDPFSNRAGDDYRLNNTASAGAVLRGVGFAPPGQTGNFDVGALQHADPAAGGGGPLINGGLIQ